MDGSLLNRLYFKIAAYTNLAAQWNLYILPVWFKITICFSVYADEQTEVYRRINQ